MKNDETRLGALVKLFTRDYDGKMSQNTKNIPNDLGKASLAGPVATQCAAATPPCRATGRRGQIVRTARMQCEAHGARKLSVSKVASELGVTRELIYYYFDGKKALVDAVLDDYVLDFAEKAAESALATRTVETGRMISVLREVIFNDDGTMRDGFKVIEDLRMREEYLSRATDAIVARLATARAEQPETDAPSSKAFGWLKLLTFGLVSTMLHNPSITDSELASMLKDAAKANAFAEGAA